MKLSSPIFVLASTSFLLLILTTSSPVRAAAEVAFDPTGNPNANPDGSFPAGETVYVVATLDSACTTATLYWGDGTSSTGASGTGIVHFSHLYSAGGVYAVYAVDQCDGRSVNSMQISVEGASLSFDIGGASFPASMLGLFGGLIIIGLANSKQAGIRGKGSSSSLRLHGSNPPSRPPRMSYRNPTGYTASPAQASPMNATVPPPIAGGTGYSIDTGQYIGPLPKSEGQLISGPGAAVGAPSDSPLAFLNAIWGKGEVTLNWGQPQFDSNSESLVGYEVSILKFGPSGTQPVQTVVAPIQPPGSSQVNLQFTQTYQFNSGGDIAGYRIDPIFSRLVDGSQTVGRSQGLFVKFGSNIGVFGPPT